MKYNDILISDFTNPYFQRAFPAYFSELGESVKNWDRFFQRMNDDGDNFAYIRLSEENNIIGFIQFKIISLKNWLFDEHMGFIREFWVAQQYRGKGHGSSLLDMAESYFVSNSVHKSILTTDTAEKLYLSKGYRKDVDITAKNDMDVFVKNLF